MDLVGNLRDVIGGTAIREIAQGYQSRVFEVVDESGRRLIAKVLDASLVDLDEVVARVGAVVDLAELDPRVCCPIPVHGNLVTEIVDDGGRPALLLCSEFAEGREFDIADRGDAELMGRTLAGLHHSLARIASRGIPEVAALRAVRSASGVSSSDPDLGSEIQLLHGDFNSGNLRSGMGGVRVFDFEDCGWGPRPFDIANSLYMVLFSATIDGEVSRYRAFEEAFLGGYANEDGRVVDRQAIMSFVDLRVQALRYWLADLSTAPVGIRTSSPDWQATLRGFVDSYAEGRR